jgi:hypothetical protein
MMSHEMHTYYPLLIVKCAQDSEIHSYLGWTLLSDEIHELTAHFQHVAPADLIPHSLMRKRLT